MSYQGCEDAPQILAKTWPRGAAPPGWGQVNGSEIEARDRKDSVGAGPGGHCCTLGCGDLPADGRGLPAMGAGTAGEGCDA